jgi:hypothetical protein
VDAKDRRAAAAVGEIGDNLAVEAAGAQQRRIEHLGPVGRGHDDHAARRVEAVHLREQLVQRLLALLVRAGARYRAGARAADRIQLVDEHDARRLRLRLLEQVAHAGGPKPDEHLHEVRPRQVEERYRGLARHRAREQRLARARRADEQHALRDPPAKPLVPPGIPEEVDHLAQLLDRLVEARHVLERCQQITPVDDLVLRLPQAHRSGGSPAHAAQQDHPHDHDQRDRQQPGEQAAQELAGTARLCPRELDVVCRQLAQQGRRVDARGARGRELHPSAAATVDAGHMLGPDLNPDDAIRPEERHEA